MIYWSVSDEMHVFCCRKIFIKIDKFLEKIIPNIEYPPARVATAGRSKSETISNDQNLKQPKPDHNLVEA